MKMKQRARTRPREEGGRRDAPPRVRIVLAAALAAVSFLPLSARADGEPLTLDRAIERVLAHHPLVASGEADLRMAEEGRREALSLFLPRIDLAESYTRSDNPVFAFGSLLNQANFAQPDFDLGRLNDPASLENFQTRLTLSQVVLSLPALAAHSRASAMVDAASAGKEAVREHLALQTIEAFHGLALAAGAVKVAEETGRAARSDLDRARAVVAAGAALESDRLQAEVRVREVEESMIEAKGNERLARLRLESLLGEPVGEIAAAPAVPETGLAERPLDDLVSDALARRPDILALASEREAARRALQAARAAFLPSLGFFASEEWDNRNFASNGSSSTTLGLTLGWSLLAGGGDVARARQAKAALEKAEARFEAREREVRFEIASALTTLESARARVEVATGGAAQAAEAHRILARGYEEGLATSAQLLGGEAALAQARLREVAAAHGVRIAAARLGHALGNLVRGSAAAPSGPASSIGRTDEGSPGGSP